MCKDDSHLTGRYVPAAPFRPKGGFLNALLRANVLTLTAVLLLIYVGFAFAYAGLYRALPNSLGRSYDPKPQYDFGGCLHYSFTTQATLGYGDYYPLGPARWLAASQALLGIILNSSLIGIIVFRLLKVDHHVRIPRICCFDPERGTFVFRFLNEGAEDLRDVSVSVSVFRYFRPDEDKLITRRGHGVALDKEDVGGVVPSGLLVAFRTKPAPDHHDDAPSLTTNDHRLAPTDLREGDSLYLQILGTVVSSGTGVVTGAEYPLRLVQCGLYKKADNDFGLLNEFTPTTEAYCASCRWHRGCPLPLAQTVR